MATFDNNDDSVVVIVGSGAGGGTLANELCQKGVKVVLLEAGKRYTIDDFRNDEWFAFSQTAWLDKRTTSGSWQVSKDFPNLPAWICKSVGGTTVHWAGASLRFQPHEFRARTVYGNVDGANLLDWPLTLEDLEPYYSRAEQKIGVTRTHGIPGLPGNNNFKVMYAGAKRLGYKTVHTGRMGINSRPRDDRPACQQIGFCFQGCKVGAKWSTLYTEIPRAEATGKLDLRTESMALQIQHDGAGKVTGVLYADKDGNRRVQKARVVCVAANSIETPRLLLNSASPTFPDGVANSSGQVGRNYMRHTTGSVYATFNRPVNMYRGTTMAGIIMDESRYDPGRGFVGGYEMETISLGVPFMAAFLKPGAWGREYTRALDQYDRMAGMWIVGEDMPRETNRITVHATEKDAFGAPIPNVHFDDHPNDVAMRNHAYKQGSAVYEAAGALETYQVPPYPSTHNLGTCRMSASSADGVCNKWGQTHDVKNLFIADGSQFTSGGAENPTLTIVSLAIRQADTIADMMSRQDI
ncbi:MAG: GMC family oxidoreductase [Gammaproteobacteria bacterium]|nr:GMC family oxidoreductase [Gammaproteobacteria bacterium]NIR83459.1 GMC family oxidoreductase [Gammaproteobacteria bacterium]NIR91381.1 GMC family oxidoreductase [Gammaproteobacteria bacterium]NIU04621.1 GMC family oxidoreductase [Gammaproteobacteria bacterium]NIV51663.1 GMC family oxidoreductase [Gammaproteobacteria bacterium]